MNIRSIFKDVYVYMNIRSIFKDMPSGKRVSEDSEPAAKLQKYCKYYE